MEKFTKMLLAGLSVLPLVCSCGPKEQKVDPKQNFQIYLCIGQSNMVGAARPEAQDSIVLDRFVNLSAVNDSDRVLGEWRPAIPPLCRYYTGICPVDYFGRTMLEVLPEDIRIGVIHVAVDGTAIRLFDKDLYQGYCDSIQADWMNNEVNYYDRNPYERLITLARQAQEEGTIRGVLLHQGCTDAYNDGWCLEVKKIYENILSDLNLQAENVPLLAGEAIGADQNGVCQHANPTIDRIHDFIPTAYTISSRGCKAGPDNLHFSAEGYRRLGRRYGIKMLQLQGYEIADDADCALQTAADESAVVNPDSVDFSNPLDK